MEPVEYSALNARQQESYNFAKVSAVLADYGFTTIRLTDDWQGADFIAQHIDGETFLKVQLKGRATIDKKYVGKGIFIAFRDGDDWFLYPHDEVVDVLIAETGIEGTESWAERGHYNFPRLSRDLRAILDSYRLRDVE